MEHKRDYFAISIISRILRETRMLVHILLITKFSAYLIKNSNDIMCIST